VLNCDVLGYKLRLSDLAMRIVLISVRCLISDWRHAVTLLGRIVSFKTANMSFCSILYEERV
jgi:hypothetical protein